MREEGREGSLIISPSYVSVTIIACTLCWLNFYLSLSFFPINYFITHQSKKLNPQSSMTFNIHNHTRKMLSNKRSNQNTTWVSLLWVTGLFSLFSRMMWHNSLLGISFITCHLTGKKPFHLSSCQKSISLLKSTFPIISAKPTNCPLPLTWNYNVKKEHKNS